MTAPGKPKSVSSTTPSVSAAITKGEGQGLGYPEPSRPATPVLQNALSVIDANRSDETGLLRAQLDALLNHCEKEGGECSFCSQVICPHHDPLHFHHDGCPSCSSDLLAGMNGSPDGAINASRNTEQKAGGPDQHLVLRLRPGVEPIDREALRTLVNEVSRNLWQLEKFGRSKVADALAPVRRMLMETAA